MAGFLLVLAVSLAVSQAASLLRDDWSTFKSVHGKEYGNAAEERMRQAVYLDNKRIVEEHNARYEKGLTTYTMALNQFADMLPHEFASSMNRYNSTLKRSRGAAFIPPQNFEAPASVDWRQKGAVTGVKDQGQSGSSWSFSATGSLEGQHFLKTGQLVSLSEQNLDDCVKSFPSVDNAFRYVVDNGGIDAEGLYPGDGSGGCRYDPKFRGATATGLVDVATGSESYLQSSVAAVGPVAAYIDAGQASFQFYSSGVYYEPECSSTMMDHTVLVVGYGSSGGSDYWLVKNSWGTSWGENGYIKMARNQNNNCGIATRTSYPLV